MSTLDLLGRGLTLCTTHPSASWQRAAPSLSDPSLVVHDVDAITARGMGIPHGGALLARPDGSTAGWWPAGTEPGAALRLAIQALPAPSDTADRISEGASS
ncbi:hypothetical protein [Rhodococcus sp. NCIMB 12038]|uniref:hypothetical protein n=1 Tax=Rhodococcus sp. NCIMB 12038 TaxID=933800 RepID=UPI000B3CF43A|nr:hypothetical protein [Rhodococcus sp. NCIMB 12038]OUS95813.1 hypothetical protein CA951_11490 [Rhodococcus sp. NCIMB 12038]